MPSHLQRVQCPAPTDGLALCVSQVRQRIAAAAANVKMEQLETMWSSGGFGGSGAASKRMLRLLGDLAQMTSQPQTDGAETTAWELRPRGVDVMVGDLLRGDKSPAHAPGGRQPIMSRLWSSICFRERYG